jgi:hypothetical protein
MILHTIFILYFPAHSNRFPILYFDRGSFILSLEVDNEGENMEIVTMIKNKIEDWLERVFISYIPNK